MPKEITPEEICIFFAQNPHRRYLVCIEGPSEEREGFTSILIVTHGDRSDATVQTIDCRFGEGGESLEQMEAWLNSDPRSEPWIERLLAGADGTVRKDADVQSRGALAALPTDSTKH